MEVDEAIVESQHNGSFGQLARAPQRQRLAERQHRVPTPTEKLKSTTEMICGYVEVAKGFMLVGL